MPDSEWCSVLGHVEFAINSTKAEGTGKSPAELVYGEPLRAPLDLIVGVEGSSQEAATFASDVAKIVQDAQQHMKAA